MMWAEETFPMKTNVLFFCLSENQLWHVQTYGKCHVTVIVNADVLQTHCWWCEAVASEGSSEQDILSCWHLSTDFIFSYHLIYKTFAKLQLQFHIKIMLLFAFFYTRTYSISKRSWGRRSNQVCPWERKFLCFYHKNLSKGSNLSEVFSCNLDLPSCNYRLTHNWEIMSLL